MEQLIMELKKIGFTELEAKCLLVLGEKGKLTGYEVSKQIGTSRSHVYTALQNLIDKGMVMISKGDPSYYDSISFQEIRKKIEANLEHSFDYLEQHYPTKSESLDDFFTLEGDRQVIERVHFEVANGQQEVIADIWSEEAEIFGDILMEIEQKDVRLIVSAVGDIPLPIKNLLVDDREESWQKKGWRKFSFVIDRKIAILGVRGKGIYTKALVTKHPAMVQLLLNNFFHDVVLHEIMSDMKEDMMKRYGRNFEEIYRKYTGMGWGE
ncbi:TrmB family transcriptional regulator [Shimazuella sp. AN120528]|uniref:TrmB family transcriptional regulator n=1 Tax=Shimazuella soli TaxID=1892854 RepID=UPI001F0F8C38|nr:helix-turn-helix domain-containing protein [Shimazuella soli]MCH5584392.1 TrmB family transcriptional regulator [Shimazuella soli]